MTTTSLLTIPEARMMIKLLEHGTVTEIGGTITIGNTVHKWEIYRHNPIYFDGQIRYHAAVGYEMYTTDSPGEAIEEVEAMIAGLREVQAMMDEVTA